MIKKYTILLCFTMAFWAGIQNGWGQEVFHSEQLAFLNSVYLVKSATQSGNDYNYKITLSTSAQAIHDFQLVELKQDVFKTKFFETLYQFNSVNGVKDSITKAPDLKRLIDGKIDDLFFRIVTASLTKIDKAPPSGYMTLEHPVIVAHDYFEFYGGVGWSKKRLIENLARNKYKLEQARDLLTTLYTGQQDSILRKKFDSLKLSMVDRFELEETDVERRLTELQKSRLRAVGFSDKQLNTYFPVLIDTTKRLSEADVIPGDTAKRKILVDSTRFRKSNKQLANLIEKIQHSTAGIKGEIRSANTQIRLAQQFHEKERQTKKLERKLGDTLAKVEAVYRFQTGLYANASREFTQRTFDWITLNNQAEAYRNLLATAITARKAEEENLKAASNRLDSTAIGARITNLQISIDTLSSDMIDYERILQGTLEDVLTLNRQLATYKELVKDTVLRQVKDLQAMRVKITNELAGPSLTPAQKIILINALRENQVKLEGLEKKLQLFARELNLQEQVEKAKAEVAQAKSEAVEIRKKLNQPSTPEGFKINSVQVEFSFGSLKNIMVIGTMTGDGAKGDSIKFINPYPIPFSAIRDFNYAAQLYSFNHRNPPDNYRYWIHLSDVFKYVPKFYNDAEDYSPADTTFVIKPQQKNVRMLHKNTVDRLLEARIYSDFVGFDDDSPNGLIQTEVSKRIILRPNRQPAIIGRRPIFFGGSFNYIEPFAALTKIEEKDKYLSLRPAYDLLQTQVTGRRARTIDLLRYANFNLGAKVNMVVLDFPQLKSSFFVDIGTSLFRTAVVDSSVTVVLDDNGVPRQDDNGNPVTNDPVVDRYNVNSLMSFLELTWQIKPDHRFGFSVSPRISYFDVKSPRVQQAIGFDPIYGHERGGTPFWMCNIQINAFIQPSANGRIFLRSNYSFMYDHMKQDFFQAQVGYSFNILKRKPG